VEWICQDEIDWKNQILQSRQRLPNSSCQASLALSRQQQQQQQQQQQRKFGKRKRAHHAESRGGMYSFQTMRESKSDGVPEQTSDQSGGKDVNKALIEMQKFRSLQDVKAGLPRVTQDNLWTAEAEDEGHTLLKDKQMPATSENKALYKLYKSCLAVMSCLPQDVISPKFLTACQISQVNSYASRHGVETSSSQWVVTMRITSTH
jgi:hypothetical protein